MSISEWAGGQVFKIVHGHNLVYNTCWEDPRLDHQAMKLTPDDTVLVITSAGCNALDYALAGPKQVVAVDMNPRQNALLELKLAGIRSLEFEDFFAMFGDGRLPGAERSTKTSCGPRSAEWPRRYWDRWIEFFEPKNRRPFYFRGTCGTFAMLINLYFNRVAKLRPRINELLECTTLDQQQEIYDRYIRDRIWSRPVRFAMRRDTVLSLLGVPRPQRHQIETQYPGGINQFVRDCLDAVFARLPLADNYFWRVYMTGRYTPRVLPGVSQAGEFPEASRRPGRPRGDAHRFGRGFSDEGPAADLAFRALGPHGLALDAAAAAVGAGVAMDRPPRRAGRTDTLAERRASDGVRRSDADRRRRPPARSGRVADLRSRAGRATPSAMPRAYLRQLPHRRSGRVDCLSVFPISASSTTCVAKPVRGRDHAARLESFYSGRPQATTISAAGCCKAARRCTARFPCPTAACGSIWAAAPARTWSRSAASCTARARSIWSISAIRFWTWRGSAARPAAGRTSRPCMPTPRSSARRKAFADVVTFSYSLTMIPDWFAAIDNALAMLRPGGTIGVTDFFVARKFPAEGRARHRWFTRTFWPAWFGSDNVFLSPDHVPYLQRRFETVRLEEHRAKVPYMPLIRVPYYTFVGKKPA